MEIEAWTAAGGGEQRFDAWGNRIAASGNPIPQYGYTGREPDETGLVYYRARYYDPTIGRFTQRDPIGLRGGINPYLYAAANPINLVDPTGLVFKGYNPNDLTPTISYIDNELNASPGTQSLVNLNRIPDLAEVSGKFGPDSLVVASGTLTINSNGTGEGSSGSGGLSGHSWITYTPDGGGTTTYGTWGNNPLGQGNGLHQDLEAGKKGDASRSAHLNDAQEANMYGVISNYGQKGAEGWKYLAPCSTFAYDAWKAGTGESLNPYGPYSNPSTLKNSIIRANGGVNDRGMLPSK